MAALLVFCVNSCKKDNPTPAPGRIILTPENPIVIDWDYRFDDNIKDLYVTKHTNNEHTIDVNLVSSAEYGVKDSTYVFSIRKWNEEEGITYFGEFNYYYSDYTFEQVAADFAHDAREEYVKVTVDGKFVVVPVWSSFNFYGGKEKSYLSILFDRPGEWKVYVYTHFANVGYNFVFMINVK